MRKLLVLLAVLVLIGGFTFAEDDSEGNGLSVGVELGIKNFNNDKAESTYPYFSMPRVVYDTSFQGGLLDLYLELDLIVDSNKELNSSREYVAPHNLYFDLGLGYNIGIGSLLKLSVLLEHEVDTLTFMPVFDNSNNVTAAIIPGLKLGYGAFYGILQTPITYVHHDKNAPRVIGLDATLGWDSGTGFGVKLKEYNLIKPDWVWYNGLDLTLSYKKGFIYTELKAEFAKYFDPADVKNTGDRIGISLIPEIDFSFMGFTTYINCRFDFIAAKDMDVMFSPALGIKYSF